MRGKGCDLARLSAICSKKSQDFRDRAISFSDHLSETPERLAAEGTSSLAFSAWMGQSSLLHNIPARSSGARSCRAEQSRCKNSPRHQWTHLSWFEEIFKTRCSTNRSQSNSSHRISCCSWTFSVITPILSNFSWFTKRVPLKWHKMAVVGKYLRSTSKEQL